MLEGLEQAREHFDAGRFDQAVDALVELPLRDDTSLDDVNTLLDLATRLRDRTQGALRVECEHQIRRATAMLAQELDPALRAERPCPLCGMPMSSGIFAVGDTTARFLIVGLSWESLWFRPDTEGSVQPRLKLKPHRGWRCQRCGASLMLGSGVQGDG